VIVSVGRGVVVSVNVGIGVNVSVGGGNVQVGVRGITVEVGLIVAGGRGDAVGCCPLSAVQEIIVRSSKRTGISDLNLIS
jgi:hypothetical protein